MLVYNLNPNAEELVEGVCYYNGEKWVALNAEPSTEQSSPIVFLLQPPGFVWLGVDGSTSTDLAVEVAQVTGADLQFQWYSRDPVTFSSTPLEGQTGTTLSVQEGLHGINTNGKVYQFYCVVINGSQYGISETGYVVYGVGARLADNDWLRFAPANLGADTDKSLAQQMAYQPTVDAAGDAANKACDPTVYGDWYQWGRKKDGHENRKTPADQTNVVYFDAIKGVSIDSLDTSSGQISNSYADFYGKFIQRNGGTHDWRQYPGTAENSDISPANSWTWSNPDNNPCLELGAGWRVPTQAEWAQIQSNNTWVWQQAGTNGTSGYQLKPLGETKPTTLFLPAAGRRNQSGGVQSDVGLGFYWSSTTTTNANSHALYFNAGSRMPEAQANRSYGLTVRCVSN
jgi:uncharacterized protein (TIGR02145 family)